MELLILYSTIHLSLQMGQVARVLWLTIKIGQFALLLHFKEPLSNERLKCEILAGNYEFVVSKLFPWDHDFVAEFSQSDAVQSD